MSLGRTAAGMLGTLCILAVVFMAMAFASSRLYRCNYDADCDIYTVWAVLFWAAPVLGVLAIVFGWRRLKRWGNRT